MGILVLWKGVSRDRNGNLNCRESIQLLKKIKATHTKTTVVENPELWKCLIFLQTRLGDCKHHHRLICSTSFPPFFLLPTSSFLGARNTAQCRVPEKLPSSEEKEWLGVEATGHQLVVMFLQPQRWSLDWGWANLGLYPANQSDWFKVWTHDYAESIRIFL